jgi:hypothetical protein
VKKEKEEEFWNYMRLLCNVGQEPIVIRMCCGLDFALFDCGTLNITLLHNKKVIKGTQSKCS